jgi:glutathione-regulated potassium-efflux system ancillary protein KefC
MDIDQLLFAAAVMMAATAVATRIARKLNLGSIVALLAVGMTLGPHSPNPLVTGHIEEMQAVGEIGVMLLLFVVGLSVQPMRLWSMRRLVFGLGSTQYVLTVAALLVFLVLISGMHQQSALVVGLGLAMSSSAIPFPILQERGENAAPQGQAALAVDIFQSFALIPVLAVIPILGTAPAQGGHALSLEKILEVLAAIAGVYVLGRFVLPRSLVLTARNLGSGAFSLVVLAGVFAASWLMAKVGISMALGAFMIGVLLSTTVFAEQVKAAATPAKQVLLGLFFIAIGMAIDPKEVVALKGDLLFYLPSVLLIKFLVVLALARVFRLGVRSAVLTGLLLMPCDEIGYVIFASANAKGLLSARSYAVGLSVISLSFVVSPLLINLGYKLSERLRKAPEPDTGPGTMTGSILGHVVVVGYGHVGRSICLMLELAHIPYVGFSIDLGRVAEARKWKHNVRYGDVTDLRMMAFSIANARSVIVATSQYDLTKRMILNLRQFYPAVPVMTAVQFLAQRDELRRMGALRVAALAPEGTMSFGRSVLDSLGVGATEADAIIASLKSNDYALLRAVGGIRQEATGKKADRKPHALLFHN